MSENKSLPSAELCGTPRTDEAMLRWERLDGDIDEIVPAQFARQLERELAEATFQLEETQRDLYDERKASLRSAPSATAATTEPWTECEFGVVAWEIDRGQIGISVKHSKGGSTWAVEPHEHVRKLLEDGLRWRAAVAQGESLAKVLADIKKQCDQIAEGEAIDEGGWDAVIITRAEALTLLKSAPSATAASNGPSQDIIDAQECLRDIFHDFDESEVKKMPTSIRNAWMVGQHIVNSSDRSKA